MTVAQPLQMPPKTSLAVRAGVSRAMMPLLAGLLLLLAIGGALVWLVTSTRTQSQQIFEAFEVQRFALRGFRAVQAAESAQRGFLLTAEDRYLDPYRASLALTAEIMRELDVRTAHEAQQHADVVELQKLVERKYAELARTIDLAKAGDTAQALDIVKTDAGRSLMDQIRSTIDRILGRAVRAIDDEYQEGQDLNRALLFATFAALVGIVAMATLVIRLNQRAMAAVQDSERATATLNETLEQAVQERTTELTESNEEIQRFAYIVSHDLRAPLVNVMGFTAELEALKGDLIGVAGKPADDPARLRIETDFDESVGYIKAAINKMEGLIAAILRLSREGRRTFRPEHIDASVLIRDLANAQKHQADEVGAVVAVAPDLPALVADRVALEQIFGNLLDNAIKYLDRSRPGRIEVTGETIGQRARITVRDNGRGIAESDHRRVFELFRRAGQQDRPGEGIGLAHVQALVRSLGGRITLASELGTGTSFTVVLPLAPRSLNRRSSIA